MIYITGDTHGFPYRFLNNYMGDEAWGEEEILIVCGDFGYVRPEGHPANRFLDELEKEKPYTICFCDGNHEFFPAFSSYPEEDWMGGRIHRIRKNVIHLMRGYVFRLCDKSFFVFGGAYSVDKADKMNKGAWFKEELPTDEEIARGLENLKKENFSVDYVITHTVPQAMTETFFPPVAPHPKELKLSQFLGQVQAQTNYRRWYFGHWHRDGALPDSVRATAVYEEVYPLDETE